MVSQLLKNDKISFVVCRNFTTEGKDYAIGDDFPQEDARDIEVFVRARFVIPVVDDIADKAHIRHWHTEVRPKDEVLERLARDRVQLRMPGPDPDTQIDLDVLTHPEQTPEQTQGSTDEPEVGGDQLPPELEPEDPAEPTFEATFDPSDHTVQEVKDYLAEHPDDTARVLAAEEAGRGRKGLLEE